MTVAAAVLAAGRGSRLAAPGGGGAPTPPKPLLRLRGRPLVGWALEAALDAGMSPVVLVVGRRGREVARAAPEGVVVATARASHRGIAHSLRVALDTLARVPAVSAVCVGLADQPLVGAEAYRRLAAAHRAGAMLAVATYQGARRNPVLVGRELFEEAHRLRGDVGARALFDAYPVVDVDCTGTGDPADVDTLDDLRALEETMR